MADIDPPASVSDPSVSPDFAPLPYKLATIITIGVWLWGLNLYGLNTLHIDVPSLIKYPSRFSHAEPPHHSSTWNFGTLLLYILSGSLLAFLLTTHNDPQALLYEALPYATLLLIALAFLVPARLTRRPDLFPSAGRSRFLATLQRVSIGGLARTEDGKFGDVLLADALTSYARPLSEVYIAVIALVWRQSTRDSAANILVPLFYAAPFAMRFRQCVTDSQYANAAKYATAFPVMFLSYFMRTHERVIGIDIHFLWLVAAFVNAMYSFYWDVMRDWDLTLFSPQRSHADYPYGLRRTRLLPDPFYYAMIAVDLVLRFAWALKLSPHLEHFYDIEGVIFILEVLEVFRRFLWVFFRVETEWIRTKGTNDVLLGELGTKIEDD